MCSKVINPAIPVVFGCAVVYDLIVVVVSATKQAKNYTAFTT